MVNSLSLGTSNKMPNLSFEKVDPEEQWRGANKNHDPQLREPFITKPSASDNDQQ